MSRLGGLCGLGAVFAGLIAAHALALEVPPLPGVTVTTPSLPVTTALPPPPPLPITTALPPPPPPPSLPVTTALPPAPALPPVTVKTPPVTVTTPPVTPPRVTGPPAPKPVAPPIVTTPTRPGTAAAPSAQAPSAPAGASASQSGGSTGSTSSTSSRFGPARSAHPAVATRTNRLRATPRRAKGRVTVRLAFTLSKAQRLFLIVRGPVPSCQVVGVIPVRGHRGVNKLTFAGRAHGRNLRPGAYLLSLSTVRQPLATAPTTLVDVVSKRRSVPAKPGAEKPTCTDAQASATSPFFHLERREGTGTGATGAGTNRGDAVSSIPPASGDGKHDVLGVATPGAGLDSGSSAEGLGKLIAIVVLTLIGAILLTTVALVTRFFRGSWNP